MMNRNNQTIPNNPEHNNSSQYIAPAAVPQSGNHSQQQHFNIPQLLNSQISLQSQLPVKAQPTSMFGTPVNFAPQSPGRSSAAVQIMKHHKRRTSSAQYHPYRHALLQNSVNSSRTPSNLSISAATSPISGVSSVGTNTPLLRQTLRANIQTQTPSPMSPAQEQISMRLQGYGVMSPTTTSNADDFEYQIGPTRVRGDFLRCLKVYNSFLVYDYNQKNGIPQPPAGFPQWTASEINNFNAFLRIQMEYVAARRNRRPVMSSGTIAVTPTPQSHATQTQLQAPHTLPVQQPQQIYQQWFQQPSIAIQAQAQQQYHQPVQTPQQSLPGSSPQRQRVGSPATSNDFEGLKKLYAEFQKQSTQQPQSSQNLQNSQSTDSERDFEELKKLYAEFQQQQQQHQQQHQQQPSSQQSESSQNFQSPQSTVPVNDFEELKKLYAEFQQEQQQQQSQNQNQHYQRVPQQQQQQYRQQAGNRTATENDFESLKKLYSEFQQQHQYRKTPQFTTQQKQSLVKSSPLRHQQSQSQQSMLEHIQPSLPLAKSHPTLCSQIKSKVIKNKTVLQHPVPKRLVLIDRDSRNRIAKPLLPNPLNSMTKEQVLRAFFQFQDENSKKNKKKNTEGKTSQSPKLQQVQKAVSTIAFKVMPTNTKSIVDQEKDCKDDTSNTDSNITSRSGSQCSQDNGSVHSVSSNAEKPRNKKKRRHRKPKHRGISKQQCRGETTSREPVEIPLEIDATSSGPTSEFDIPDPNTNPDYVYRPEEWYGEANTAGEVLDDLAAMKTFMKDTYGPVHAEYGLDTSEYY